jgi:hypothetical protein
VSSHLAKLRALDIVRYETAGGHVRCWLKHPNEMKRLLEALGGVVEVSAKFGR